MSFVSARNTSRSETSLPSDRHAAPGSAEVKWRCVLIDVEIFPADSSGVPVVESWAGCFEIGRCCQ